MWNQTTKYPHPWRKLMNQWITISVTALLFSTVTLPLHAEEKTVAKELLEAPTTVKLDTVTVTMESQVIVNKMPTIGGPPRKPYVIAKLKFDDKPQLPKGWGITKLWTIQDKLVWEVPKLENRGATAIARNMPDWKAKKPVTVVVQFETAKKKQYLIRASAKIQVVH